MHQCITVRDCPHNQRDLEFFASNPDRRTLLRFPTCSCESVHARSTDNCPLLQVVLVQCEHVKLRPGRKKQFYRISVKRELMITPGTLYIGTITTDHQAEIAAALLTGAFDNEQSHYHA